MAAGKLATNSGEVVGGGIGGINEGENGGGGGDAATVASVLPPLLQHDVGDIKMEPAQVDTFMGEADPLDTGDSVHV